MWFVWLFFPFFFHFLFYFFHFHLPASSAASSLPIPAAGQAQTVPGSGKEILMGARNTSRKNSQIVGSLQASSRMSGSLCCLLQYWITVGIFLFQNSHYWWLASKWFLWWFWCFVQFLSLSILHPQCIEEKVENKKPIKIPIEVNSWSLLNASFCRYKDWVWCFAIMPVSFEHLLLS